MHNSQYDFLLIGQGLAGSILAHTLITRGFKVMVIDNKHSGSSSQVAAGIINPITGHRLNISDRFEDYFTIAKTYYEKLNGLLDTPVYQTTEQIRLIKNLGQYEYLQKRLKQNSYNDYLATSTKSRFPNADFGEIAINQTATVNTKKLLQQIKSWLIEQDCYAESKFSHTELKQNGDQIQYQTITAQKIIFCEGYQAMNNVWLQKLPFKFAKGDILTIDTKQSTAGTMLNWGNWLVSHGTSSKLGSSFVWDSTSLNPTPEIETTLLESLYSHTKIRAKVINHEVGIRPSTTQRKPFIGAISKLSNSYCFNGFGSKGCLLIPYYAALLADHLIEKKPLPDELSKWL